MISFLLISQHMNVLSGDCDELIYDLLANVSHDNEEARLYFCSVIRMGSKNYIIRLCTLVRI